MSHRTKAQLLEEVNSLRPRIVELERQWREEADGAEATAANAVRSKPLFAPQSANQFILIGLALTAAFWVIDPLVDAGIFGEGSIRQQLFSPSGLEIWIRTFVSVLLLAFSLYARSVFIDRKRAQDELRQHQEELAHVARLSTMGEMATGLAHELNQPLAAMTNYCYVGEHLLADTKSANREQLRGLFEKLTAQAMRAGEVIRRLRALVGTRTTVRAPVDVAEPIREVLQLLEPDLHHSEVRVALRVGHSNRLAIMDDIQIQQVLLNLFRNALDAMSKTERGHRRLKITTSNRSDDMIEVTVRDSGRGIPVEETEQVFDAFVSSKSDGMGMGLTISRTIVESHGGRLWMTPNSDRGVTVRLTLPFASKESGDGDG